MNKSLKYLFFIIIIYGISVTYLFITYRPSFIHLDPEMDCSITANAENFSKYIISKSGLNSDFNSLNRYLLRNGFFLMSDDGAGNKIYVSSGDGNVCLMRFLAWDKQILYMKVSSDNKVISLRGSK